MKNFNHNIFAILIIFILCGGSSANATQVIFTDECPISKKKQADRTPHESLGVLAILAKAAIPVALDWGAAALAAQGQPDTKTWNSNGSSNLYRVESVKDKTNIKWHRDWSCLVILVADSSNESNDKNLNTEFHSQYKEIKDINLSKNPLIYTEFEIETSNDNRYFRLIPQVLYYKKSTVNGWWNKQRDLSFTLNFNKPGVKDPFASTTISFENLSPGGYYDYASSTPAPTTEWLDIAGLDETEKKRIADYKDNYEKYELPKNQISALDKKISIVKERMSTPYPKVGKEITSAITEFCKQLEITGEESDNCPPQNYLAKKQAAYEVSRLELAKTLDDLNAEKEKIITITEPKVAPGIIGAFNLSAVITETRNASEFLKHLSTAINNSKKDISDEVVKKLIPEERRLAKEKEDVADISAAAEKDISLIAALTARSAVTKAQSDLDTAKAKTETSDAELSTLQDALLIAKINANKAYRAAGLPTISVTIPAIP